MHDGLHVLHKNVSKAIYAHSLYVAYGEIVKCKLTYEEALKIDDEQNKINFIEWHEAQKINKAFYARVKRLKNKITKMLEGGTCIFLTFTFTDEVLKKTTADTRRQKIRRFLNFYDAPYVANIDFGAKNGREHYHAIIQIDKINYSLYDYGALNGKKIKSTSDSIKLAKYISKLTNHAIKETTKRNSIIYSR